MKKNDFILIFKGSLLLTIGIYCGVGDRLGYTIETAILVLKNYPFILFFSYAGFLLKSILK